VSLERPPAAAAHKRRVELTGSTEGSSTAAKTPLTFQVRPGDTILVGERWF